MDRPIIFSGPMVRALLDGRKTQTRRLATSPLRKAEVGDHLWVREKWQLHSRASDLCTVVYGASETRSWTEFSRQFPDTLAANLSPKPFQLGWRSSLHMPRWATRLTLTVTDVRVEPLQAITDDDAKAEGIVEHETLGWHVPGIEHPIKAFPILSRTTPRLMYAALWDTLHGSGEWLGNPEVLVLTFAPIADNVDRLAA